MSPWIFFGGKVVSATVVALVAVTLMLAVGVPLYGVTIFPELLPAAILTFLVGVGCFAALGLLVAAVAPNGNAATAGSVHEPQGAHSRQYLRCARS